MKQFKKALRLFLAAFPFLDAILLKSIFVRPLVVLIGLLIGIVGRLIDLSSWITQTRVYSQDINALRSSSSFFNDIFLRHRSPFLSKNAT